MKIKCPHCGATNQDVSENDPCWQCGTVLSAPTSALSTADGPPTSEANAGAPTSPAAIQTTSAATPTAAPPPVQPRVPQTVQRPAPTPAPVESRSAPAQRATNWVPIAVVIALIVILIIIGVMFFRPH